MLSHYNFSTFLTKKNNFKYFSFLPQTYFLEKVSVINENSSIKQETNTKVCEVEKKIPVNEIKIDPDNPLPEIKAFIFDLDGVICDTAEFHFLAWRRLSEEKIGFTLTESQNELLKGVSRKDSLEILISLYNEKSEEKKIFSEEEKIELCDIKNGWYIKLIDDMKPEHILNGVMSFLTEIKRKKYKIACASSSKNAIKVLNKLGIQDLFDAIIDGNAIKNSKPHPEVFLKASESLRIPPINCVVFEDAKSGVKAALEGNMFSVGIGKEEDLGEAHLVLSGFEGLNIEKILNLPNEFLEKKLVKEIEKEIIEEKN